MNAFLQGFLAPFGGSPAKLVLVIAIAMAALATGLLLRNSELVHNWRRVLAKAWSVRLMLLAAFLSAVEVTLPLVQEIVMVPAGWFALLSAAATFAALIARLLAQRTVSGDCE